MWFGNPGWRSANIAALAPAASTWTPASLTNLVGWWSADSGVSTTSGNVTSVTDLSGHGYTLTPFHNTSAGTVAFSATGFNGKPTFNFTNANDSALATGGVVPAVTLPSTSALSMFFVGQMLTGTPSSGRAGVIGHGGNSDYNVPGNMIVLMRDSTSNAIISYYNNNALDSTSFSLATNYRFGVIIGGGTITHYVNNAASTGVATTISLDTPNQIGIGNEWAAGGWSATPWEGPISEIVVASADITSDLTNLDNYFKAHWGL